MSGEARTGGRILVDQLVAQGVERIACVPGESFLPVLDALVDTRIDLIVCRNEGGAAMMAEAYGKLTGRPGICFVTRGPGACNAAHGVHIASQDSTPMILFIGQVERGFRERDTFQEIDYKSMFGGLAKWVAEADDPGRLPEFVARAFRVAMQGRPGPVVIALPEDVLHEAAIAADAPMARAVETSPAPEDINALFALLETAQSPIAILGGSRWSPQACAALQRFAEKTDLPVACSFRRAQLFPADHPNFAGDLGFSPNPKLAARVRDADLVLLAGGRFSEVASQSYSLLSAPRARQKLVHVHPSTEELGRVYQPDLAIHASPQAFARALEAAAPPPPRAGARAAVREAHAEYLAWSRPPDRPEGAFAYGAAIAWLRERLPRDAIIANGAGNYAAWVHRYFRFAGFGAQLAPTSGSMGYGVPAAIMAKRQFPERIVVAFAGDGCFLMNGQEFATAVQYDVPVIVIVVDNAMYGTIRLHQEKAYPGRVSGTALRNPDFAALARAFGGHGEHVARTEDFAPAFERALASGKPAILHCMLDPDAIAPEVSLAQVRAAALQGPNGRA